MSVPRLDRSRRLKSLLCAVLLVGINVAAATPSLAREQRILQRDAYGNVRHDQPSWAVQDNGRVVPVDRYGNKRYDQPGYQIQGDKVYQRDTYGNTRYDRPSQLIRKEK